MHCQYWAREDVQWPKEKPSAAAARGTRVHEMIATASPDFDTDDWALRRVVQALGIVKVHAGGKHELTLAMDADGTRVVGSLIGRDQYPTDAFCGTIDYIFPNGDGTWTIYDWKTGSPSDNEEGQLRALSTMATEAGMPVSSAKAVYLTDGLPRFGQSFIEPIDIRKSLVQVDSSEPVPGTHCSGCYCPMRKTCPALT